MTFALFQAGWHWPLVAVAVFIVAATLAVVGAGQSESEWLGARKRSFKRLAWLAAALLVIALFAGQLHKLKGMLLKVQDGDPKWLGFAVGVEAISFVGYVALSWELFRPHAPRLTLPACVEMTFGGVVATRPWPLASWRARRSTSPGISVISAAAPNARTPRPTPVHTTAAGTPPPSPPRMQAAT